MEPEQEEHRDKQAILQGVVAEVARDMPGQSVAQLMDAIRAGAVAAGLQPPPETWLRGAATNAARGDVYVLSEEAVEDAGVDVPALREAQAPSSSDGGDQPN